MKTELLCAREITKTANSVIHLHFVNFQICSGEIIGIIGLNTSGVSTFIDIITGFTEVDSGSFFVDTKPVMLGTVTNARMQGIFRIRALSVTFPHLSIVDNIGMFSRDSFGLWRNAKKMIKVFAQDMFAQYDIKISLDQKVGALSNYEKNVIEIICAIVCKAKIIVLDNVIGEYTDKEFRDMMTLINRIKATGTAFIIADTRINTMITDADRIYVMCSGYIGRIYYKDEYDQDMIYKTLTSNYEKRPQGQQFDDHNAIVMKLEHYSIPGKAKDINIEIKQGEAVGFVNKNKTVFYEIINALSGRIKTEGNVWLNGKKLVIKSWQDAFDSGIGRIDGNYTEQVFLNFTLAENLVLMIYPDCVGAGRQALNRRMLKFAAHEYAQMFQIDLSYLDKPLSEFDEQFLLIVLMMRWVIAKPKVLLLNNVFAYADVVIRDAVLSYIQMLKNQGTAIIIYSPILSEINQFCDRIYEIEA